jgi:hypothetical protein
LLNGARVTLSKIEVDVISGQFVATDALIHTPNWYAFLFIPYLQYYCTSYANAMCVALLWCFTYGSDQWKWDSPVIARFGRVTGKLSLLSLLDPISTVFGYTWREINYVICEDIQVFIEKRRNVFNFHLLDESLQIPEPSVMKDLKNQSSIPSSTDHNTQNVVAPDQNDTDRPCQPSPDLSSTVETTPDTSQNSTIGTLVVPEQTASAAEKKANEIVFSMLKTVSTLGKAANKGGKNELDRLLKNQRDNIVKTLREFQDKGIGARNPMADTSQEDNGEPKSTVFSNGSASSCNPYDTTKMTRRQGSSSMEIMARESLKVVRSMGKAVERNVSEIQLSLKPPQKKDGFKSPDDWIRIGWLTFREVRIFTKDIILSSSKSSNSPNLKINPTKVDPSHETPSQSNNWSVPILLKEVSFGGTDLSNPVSFRENGLPVIGLKPDQLVDVLIRRALSEMAKSNTGRLFSNAMGEFFAWMDTVGSNNNNPGGSSGNAANAIRP